MKRVGAALSNVIQLAVNTSNILNARSSVKKNNKKVVVYLNYDQLVNLTGLSKAFEVVKGTANPRISNEGRLTFPIRKTLKELDHE